MRRFLILPLSLFIALLVPVLPASAGTDCQLHVPAAVTVTAPHVVVWPTFTDCAGVTATWTIFGGGAKLGTFGVVNGSSQGGFRFNDSYPVGRLTTSSNTIPNGPSFVVKYGSTISLKSSRVSDLKVPLKGVVSRYVPSVNEFRRWAHRTVSISYKDCPDCPWKFLALDKTNEYGAFSLGAVSYEARYYRAKVGETTTTWGRTSASTYN